MMIKERTRFSFGVRFSSVCKRLRIIVTQNKAELFLSNTKVRKYVDFCGASDSSAEHPGVIPRQGDSLEKNWIPTPVFLPGEFCGRRSLVDYSPWGCKE